MRILLLADSEAIKKAIFITFAPYSIFIVKASSLKETEELIRRDRFDAIIADIDTKDAHSAKDFLSLQQKIQQAPLILLHGSYSSIDAASCTALGLKHIIKKPFDAAKLLQMFETKLHLPLTAIPTQRHEPENQSARTGAVTQPVAQPSSVPLHIGQQVDLEKLIEKEVQRILPSMLEDYCRSHFEQVASKVIQLEIEKLDHSRRFDAPGL